MGISAASCPHSLMTRSVCPSQVTEMFPAAETPMVSSAIALKLQAFSCLHHPAYLGRAGIIYEFFLLEFLLVRAVYILPYCKPFQPLSIDNGILLLFSYQHATRNIRDNVRLGFHHPVNSRRLKETSKKLNNSQTHGLRT